MNDKQIAFVVNSTSGGGAEVSAMTVYRELISSGYNIKIIAINRNQFSSRDESDSIFQIDRSWKSGLRNTISAFISFQRIIRKLKPDIVVAHCELPELFCAFIPSSRFRLFAVEHTSSPWEGRRTLGRVIRSILKFRKIKWITVDKSQRKIWLGENNPIHIANPVASNEIVEQPRIPEGIAFIGRIREEKRPEWAINAAIENSLPIAVIGDGENKTLLMDRYREYKNLVTFYGFIENPWSRLSPETLIVMPSKFEGDGLVAVEALINGFSIALADNKDLRRFELPSGNYFTNERELTAILRRYKDQGVKSFKIPNSTILEITAERDIKTVTKKWIQVLNMDEPHV